MESFVEGMGLMIMVGRFLKKLGKISFLMFLAHQINATIKRYG
jgi:hypothetical protein